MSLEKHAIDRKSPEAQNRFIPGLAGACKGVDTAKRTITGTASTINIDRDGEIILPSAFRSRWAQFMASNAPFAAAHTHRSSDGSPTQIGWVIDGAIESDRIATTFRLGTTTLAEEWWKLASDPAGKGIAFSIGFYPVQWVRGTKADLVRMFPELAGVLKAAKEGDEFRVYTEIELVEISGVMAPSNRQSVQDVQRRAFGSADGSEGTLDAMFDGLQKRINEMQSMVLDRLSELQEAILLAPETNVGIEPEADPSGRGEGDPGAGAGEAAEEDGAETLRAALNSLGKTCAEAS